MRFLTLLMLVAASVSRGGPPAFAQGPRRPNVLLLFADDQRADTIGADPDEMRDLATLPEHAEQVERLTARMASWQEKVGHRQPLRVETPRPKEVRFDDYIREPDPWQPDWIVTKYFQGR